MTVRDSVAAAVAAVENPSPTQRAKHELALALAVRIDAGEESGLAAVARELRMLLDDLPQGMAEESKLDELRARRTARRDATSEASESSGRRGGQRSRGGGGRAR